MNDFKTRFFRAPSPRTRWILVAAVAALGIVSSLVILLSSPAVPRVTASAPLSQVLDAADAGLLESVSISPTSAAAFVKDGVSEIGGVSVQQLPDGAAVAFLAPTSVQSAVLEQFMNAGVQVRFTGASSPATVRGPVVYEMHSDVPARPTWLTPASVMMLIASCLLLAVSLLRIRVARAAQPGPDVVAAPPSTTFADVAGADEAVASLGEMVEFLKDPSRFEALGAKVPAGALLVGPPGTGKTLLAKAVAGEAGVAFFATSGADFTEMYVGVGPKRVRQLFARARKAGKAVIFIDEVDAVARRRSDSSQGGGHHESENTMMALLTEMDGFTSRTGIIVLAATNRPDVLDPALTRPGRLDRKVEVPLPDRRGREQILAVHAAKVPLAEQVSLSEVAARTPGFSGASLAAVVNEAAIEAARRGLSKVTPSCVDDAVASVAMGRARTSALVSDHDRAVTAWHEAGHTVAALLLADADKPVAVSIVPRGPAGGVTWMSEGEDLFLSRSRAHARLVVALAGRAGEQLLLDGEFTQGASGDLDSATNLALLMTTRYGMTRLGLASREAHLGGTSTTAVTEVVEELLAAAAASAHQLLLDHFELVEGIATALLEHEDLSSAQLAEIASSFGVDPHRVGLPSASIPAPAVSDTVHAPVPVFAAKPSRLMRTWHAIRYGRAPA